MRYFDSNAIEDLPSRHRANLINTITGYKSANLIGTANRLGRANVAIFNSVVHLGSNPALLGFVLRPLTVRRDTYRNISENRSFTVNAVTEEIYEAAHHTAAKFEENESEFAATGLQPLFREEHPAPFVSESPIQLGCTYVNEYPIMENGCIFIVGQIEHIHVNETLLTEDLWAKLDEKNIVSIVGLDGYAKPKITDRLAYAKRDEPVKSILHGAQKV
ncbi:MAG: flavin reductase family protein [Bacteroidota bacterium]